MILVTGATGHIGNVLVRELVAGGQPVRALLLPGEDRTPLEGLRVQCVEGDVRQPDNLASAMQGVDLVFHLAGVISIVPGQWELLRAVNVQGTRNVLQAARAAGVRRLVYTSSIHALARPPHGLPIDEHLPFDPNNPHGLYDRSKAQASLAVEEAVRQGLDAVIACPTGVIGPYDFRLSEMGRLILDAMRYPLHFQLPGGYDFVDVRDVAHGLLLAAERGRPGERYILGGQRISMRAIVDTVRRVRGMRALQVPIPLWLARLAARLALPFYRLTRLPPRLTPYALETVLSNADIRHDKARRELGYRPRPLSRSIADSVAWFRANARLLVRLHRRPWALL